MAVRKPETIEEEVVVEQPQSNPEEVLVEFMLPRAGRGEDSVQFLKINGKQYHIPRGKMVRKPKFVYDRAMSIEKARDRNVALQDKLDGHDVNLSGTDLNIRQ